LPIQRTRRLKTEGTDRFLFQRKREGVCAASLPTTMGMVAGMLVQNSLKFLLNFGTVTMYLGYSALTDFFPTMTVGCTVDCDNDACRAAQSKHRAKIKSPEYLDKKRVEKELAAVALLEELAMPLHNANEWNIEVASGAFDESADAVEAKRTSPSQQANQTLGEGIQFSMPKAEKLDDATVQTYKVQDTGAGLEDLMSQLQGLNARGAK
jgi:ubiquitin-like modifier-activating enzyme 5